MSTLVTGCKGFIGFNLIKELSQEGYNPIYGIDHDVRPYQSKVVDLRASELEKLKNFNMVSSLSVLSNKHIDRVIHLGALANGYESTLRPHDYIKQNIEGTLDVLDFCKSKDAELIFSSSSSVYGGGPCSPQSRLRSKHIYSATKVAAEKLIEAYMHSHRVRSKIYRFFTVFGEYGRPDMVIYKFLQAAKNNEPLVIHDSGDQRRNMTYVGDIVKKLRAAEVPKDCLQTENISGGYEVSILQIAKYISKRYGATVSFCDHPYKGIDAMQANPYGETEHFSDARIKFYENLKSVCDWYDENWEHLK